MWLWLLWCGFFGDGCKCSAADCVATVSDAVAAPVSDSATVGVVWCQCVGVGCLVFNCELNGVACVVAASALVVDCVG